MPLRVDFADGTPDGQASCRARRAPNQAGYPCGRFRNSNMIQCSACSFGRPKKMAEQALAVSHQRHSGRLRLEPDAALVHDVRHGHACRDLTGVRLDRTVPVAGYRAALDRLLGRVFGDRTAPRSGGSMVSINWTLNRSLLSGPRCSCARRCAATRIIWCALAAGILDFFQRHQHRCSSTLRSIRSSTLIISPLISFGPCSTAGWGLHLDSG